MRCDENIEAENLESNEGTASMDVNNNNNTKGKHQQHDQGIEANKQYEQREECNWICSERENESSDSDEEETEGKDESEEDIRIIEERPGNRSKTNVSDEDDKTIMDEDLPYEKLKKREEKWEKRESLNWRKERKKEMSL